MIEINKDLTKEIRLSVRAAKKRYLESDSRKLLQEVLTPAVMMIDGEIYANLGMRGYLEGGEQGWARSRLRETVLKLEGLKKTTVTSLQRW